MNEAVLAELAQIKAGNTTAKSLNLSNSRSKTEKSDL